MPDEEVAGLQGELNAILSFVETLSEVDVEGIEPMTSVMPMRMATRDDVVNDGGIAVAVTANAPAAEDHFFTGAEGHRVKGLPSRVLRPSSPTQESPRLSDLTSLTLAEARDGLKAKRFSAVELATAQSAAVTAAKALNCFIVETPELALTQARLSDSRLASGEGRPLEGIPLAIKDLYCTKSVQTTAGSRILEGFVPPYESTVSANLWRAGATHAR